MQSFVMVLWQTFCVKNDNKKEDVRDFVIFKINMNLLNLTIKFLQKNMIEPKKFYVLYFFFNKYFRREMTQIVSSDSNSC